jgi:hypothetical protein
MRGKAWLIGSVACLAAACGGSSGAGGLGGVSGGGAAGQAGVAGTAAGGTGGVGGAATGNKAGAGGAATGGRAGGAGTTTGQGGSAGAGGAPTTAGQGGSAGAGGANIQSGGEGGHAGQPTGSAGQGGVAATPTGGQAGTGSGSGGQGGGGVQVTGRRLPWPCTAALPTGFCMQSDAGDFIGHGESYGASGPGSVTLHWPSAASISVVLSQPTPNTGPWDLGVSMPMGAVLTPGLYVRASPSDPTSASLSVSGEGHTCGAVTGQFSLEELTRGPGVGVTRFSFTFELHCGGDAPALRGVVNYQATGTPDPTPVPDRVIALSGKIFRVAYDPTANVAYGLDATNTRIGKINLATGTTSYVSVTHVPNDACVDSARGRLFVVNKGSQTITEYATNSLSVVRDIAWMSMDRAPSQTRFQIYCTPDRLYAVDGASIPALFTVEGLDSAAPVVTDHSAELSAVNGLAVNAAGTDLYAWYQRYKTPTGVYVSRSRVSDLAQLDVSSMTLPNFGSAPSDAPLLLDESRGYVFVKDRVFDASHLTNVTYTLPGTYDTLSGPQEVAYALNASGGFLATKNFVYELSRFDAVAATIVPASDQLFFDSAGKLWMLSTAQATLTAQLVHR